MHPIPEASGNTHARQPWPLKEIYHGPQSSAYPLARACRVAAFRRRPCVGPHDVAKGIKSFKKGLADDDEVSKPMTKIEAQPAPTVIEAEKQADKQA